MCMGKYKMCVYQKNDLCRYIKKCWLYNGDKIYKFVKCKNNGKNKGKN